MNFSILFEKGENSVKTIFIKPPVFFADMNLNLIIDEITADRQYDLRPFFYTPLKDINAIKYRNEIFHDLENKSVFESIKLFTQQMHATREHLFNLTKCITISKRKLVSLCYGNLL